MKRSRSLLLACSFSLLPSAFAVEVGETVNTNKLKYTADGVYFSAIAGTYTTVRPANSTRFYDSEKGGPWTTHYGDGTEGDSLMCWSHAGANLIQYWQSYYGVFYKGTKDLPYGSDYLLADQYNVITQKKDTVADPTKLNVAKNIYQNFTNSPGTLDKATNFFFTYANSGGGYYSDYFGVASYNNQPVTHIHNAVDNIAELTQAVLPAFGIDASTQKKTEMGLIPYIGVSYDTTNSNGDTLTYGHSLTCYGFTTNSNGQLTSLLLTNSDDETPRVVQAYVKMQDGKLVMYEDAACTTRWHMNTENDWYISSVSHIKTPEVLQNMLAEYSDMEEALVWNGAENGEWKTQAATTAALPTTATGWDVLVNGNNIDAQHHGYYNSYAADHRDVRFDSHASSQEVTIVGTVTPGNIEIAEGDYVFKAGLNAAITGSGDVTIRSGASLTSSVDFGTRNIKLEAGAALCSSATIAVRGEFHSLAATQQASTFALSNAPAATVEADLDLREATALTIEAEVDMTGHDLFLSDEPVTLTMSLNPDTKNVLFCNIGILQIGNSAVTNGFSGAAAQYFTSATEDLTQFYLVYNNNTVSLQTFIEGDAVPEPTSATLSLMALTALAARRRRRK